MPDYRYEITPDGLRIGLTSTAPPPATALANTALADSAGGHGDAEELDFWADFYDRVFRATSGCYTCQTKLRTAVREFSADRRATHAARIAAAEEGEEPVQ